MRCIAVVALFATVSLGSFDEYRIRSIEDVVETELQLFQNEDLSTCIELNMGDFKYKSVVTFTGNVREIDMTKQSTFIYWLRTHNADVSMSQYYNYEIQIQTGDSCYWMPIQDILYSPFFEEINPGDSFIVYYMYVALAYNDWLFYVTEFQSL